MDVECLGSIFIEAVLDAIGLCFLEDGDSFAGIIVPVEGSFIRLGFFFGIRFGAGERFRFFGILKICELGSPFTGDLLALSPSKFGDVPSSVTIVRVEPTASLACDFELFSRPVSRDSPEASSSPKSFKPSSSLWSAFGLSRPKSIDSSPEVSVSPSNESSCPSIAIESTPESSFSSIVFFLPETPAFFPCFFRCFFNDCLFVCIKNGAIRPESSSIHSSSSAPLCL
mmetsp:Transcript_36828/g.89220  ORF Transcript_36828/g.89220 Transcript_36828/m.89220 type:complete len:227 (-) Transcript_36828:5596-6276(-)